MLVTGMQMMRNSVAIIAKFRQHIPFAVVDIVCRARECRYPQSIQKEIHHMQCKSLFIRSVKSGYL